MKVQKRVQEVDSTKKRPIQSGLFFNLVVDLKYKKMRLKFETPHYVEEYQVVATGLLATVHRFQDMN